jgi:hypothetical protein
MTVKKGCVMHLKKINSRSLVAVGYDPSVLLLEVKFKVSGSIYAFLEVQREIYQAFMNASSKGAFFNKYIKSRYKYFKVR